MVKDSKPLNAWLPSRLAERLDHHIKTASPRVTKTACVIAGLELFLDQQEGADGSPDPQDKARA